MAFSMDYGTGFEMGSNKLVPASQRVQTSVVDSAHTGDYTLRVDSEGGGRRGWMRFAPSGSPSELYISAWVYAWGAYEMDSYFRIYVKTSGGDISIRFRSDHYWDAFVDGVKVADGAVNISTNSWHSVQLHVVIGNSGTIETKIDGIDDVNYSGDTQPGASSVITWVQPYLHETSDCPEVKVDDFCFGTGGWPGDIRFDALVPDGDNSVTWTGSDGNQVDNYALIDEAGPNDADYVRSTANAEQDKYDLADWDGTDKTPTTVILWARVKKDEAAAHLLKLILDDGTENVSAGHNLLTSFGYVHRLDETPPSGGAWDESTIDDLKVGVESEIV